jgi:hypothetical protein
MIAEVEWVWDIELEHDPHMFAWMGFLLFNYLNASSLKLALWGVERYFFWDV